MGERIGVTDEEWALIGPLLPAERGRGCRPAQDNRRYFEGMMWMARTGAQWRRLPDEYGKWNSVFRRYRRWVETGVFEALLETLAVVTTGIKTDKPEAIPADALPLVKAGRGYTMLDGIRIIDLTTSIAGPLATMLLADMGAEVLKVERPNGGDDARAWGPPFLDGEALWFASVNRNKKSIVLDYSSSDGLEILHRLVKTADMLVVNMSPRVARKLKIDVATLRALRADLIYVSITGFGIEGERADWTCYDLIAEGYSGIMDVTGEAGREAQKVGAPAADMLAGQDAAFGAIAALFDRQRTGKGHVVDVALVDSMTRFLSCRIMPYLGSGNVPTRSGGRDSVIAIYQAFETADDPITLGLGNDSLWQRFWDAVGQPEQASLDGRRSNIERRQHRDAIVAVIASILREKPRSHWLRLFAVARVPAGPINRIDQVVADETLHHRGLFYRMTAEDGRIVPQVGTGFLIDGTPNVPRCAPPRLGEHTDDVLRELNSSSPQ